jgi:peroxiredoxin
MANIGDTAPDFRVPDQNGDMVTLSQYKGSKNVVLSFHIFSFTGG